MFFSLFTSDALDAGYGVILVKQVFLVPRGFLVNSRIPSWRKKTLRRRSRVSGAGRMDGHHCYLYHPRGLYGNQAYWRLNKPSNHSQNDFLIRE